MVMEAAGKGPSGLVVKLVTGNASGQQVPA